MLFWSEFFYRRRETLVSSETSPLYEEYKTDMQKRQLLQKESDEPSALEKLRITAVESEDSYAVFSEPPDRPYATFHTPPSSGIAASQAFPLTPPTRQEEIDAYGVFEGTPDFSTMSTASSLPNAPEGYDSYGVFEESSTLPNSFSGPSFSNSTPNNASGDDVIQYQVGSLVDKAAHIVSSGASSGDMTEALSALTEALNLLLPKLSKVPMSKEVGIHPLVCAIPGTEDELWNGSEMCSVWVFNCGGHFLLHSGLGKIHEELLLDPKDNAADMTAIYSSEVSWDNDTSGTICFPPPSALFVETLTADSSRWKELLLARILTTRGAALVATTSNDSALSMYQKVRDCLCALRCC